MIQVRLQSLQGCKSLVSMAIAECFYLLDSKLDLGCNKYANKYFEDDEMGISHWVYLVWQRGLDQVTAEITHSKNWPLFTPSMDSIIGILIGKKIRTDHGIKLNIRSWVNEEGSYQCGIAYHIHCNIEEYKL
jgi:hypothetical protein